MKPTLSRIFILLFLFSIQTSFAQTITKKRGKVTTHYGNGVKESSGKVKHYKKQGVWSYWDGNGDLQSTITFKDDVREGMYTEYFPGRGKSMEGNYAHGEKDGVWHEWYSDGKVKSETIYKNGKLEGVKKTWHSNGKLESQANYERDTCEYFFTWYDNGDRHEMKYYKNGLADGTWKYYALRDAASSLPADTLPISIDHYSNGKKNGIHQGFKQGKMVEEFYYKDDVLNGAYKVWDDSGYLRLSEAYKNGKLEGECNYYNTSFTRTIHYTDGRKNGEEKKYDGTGHTFFINWYKQGVLDSAFTFHSNGKVATSRVYMYYPGFVRTEEFSIYQEWDSDGHLLLKGKYHFEEKDQDWTTYYPNGKVKSITPYSAGKMKGVYKKWYANGKEMIEFECDGSSVVSKPKVWDEKGKPIKAGTNAYQEIVDSSLPGEMYNDPNNYKENRTSNGHYPPPPVRDMRYDPNSDAQDVMEMDQEGDVGDVLVPDDERPLPKDTDMVYTFVEEMPKFPGSEGAMNAFIAKNAKYPYTGDNLKTGRVWVSFVVEKDGSITNIEAVKEVSGAPELTKEAIRVVSLFPKWECGKMNGKAVRTKMIIPIGFYPQ